ncbi:MAG TPA: DUF6220 domain-containing protein [Dehalococcoidia bacterium]|nr:DUF6220 domain-containing protein [Dehalococcoidia bacterium]
MAMARKILVGLAWLFVLGVMLEFFFAGLGLLGGEDMELHEGFGWGALQLLPVLILIAAFFAKPARSMLILVVALLVVSFFQPFWVTEFRGEFLGSFHVLGAAVILALAHAIAQRATHLVRAGA